MTFFVLQKLNESTYLKVISKREGCRKCTGRLQPGSLFCEASFHPFQPTDGLEHDFEGEIQKHTPFHTHCTPAGAKELCSLARFHFIVNTRAPFVQEETEAVRT